jgi:membrane fusion protein (multidrug efflux system)
LLVPQQAVSELQGSFQAAIVDRNNAVNIQAIKVGDQIGSSWVILDGLNPGDRVIVDGIQKVTTGMHVIPKESPQKSGA